MIEDADKCGVTTFSDADYLYVEYGIDIHDDYKGSGYMAGDNVDPKFSAGGTSYVSELGESSSIENLISAVMFSSKQVAKDADAPIDEGRFMFKITSSVEMGKVGGADKYVITYHINRYKAVTIKKEKLLTFEPPEDEAGNVLGIEFDYIFTGQNIDVIEFDIKMQMGLVFYQMMSVQGTSPTSAGHMLKFQNDRQHITGSGVPSLGDAKEYSDKCGASPAGPIKKPLFLGTTLKHPMFRDLTFAGESASFNSMLHRHAALENLGCKLKIRGNPQLLSDTTQQPEDVLTTIGKPPPEILPEGGGGTTLEAIYSIMPKIHEVPAYVKVRVWSPKSWTGSSEKTEAEKAASYEGDFAENLWYDGWYYVLQIDHVFSDGLFTQELELLSLPFESEDTKVGSCIEERLKTREEERLKEAKAPTTPKPPAPVTTPPPSSTTPPPATVGARMASRSSKAVTATDIKWTTGGGV